MKCQILISLILTMFAVTNGAPSVEAPLVQNATTESHSHPSASATTIRSSTKGNVPAEYSTTAKPKESTTQHGSETTTAKAVTIGKEHNTTTTKSEKKAETKPVTGKLQQTNKQTNNKTGRLILPKFVEEGKVLVFSGICGSDGCAIEGDIYDDPTPLMKRG